MSTNFEPRVPADGRRGASSAVPPTTTPDVHSGRTFDEVAPERTEVHTHTTTHEASPAPQPANTDVRRDRTRWGAVWTGVLTTLTTYIALQLLFFAAGWLDLGVTGANSSTTRAVVSAVLALIAFFLGGMATGASALWRRASDGIANGVVTWATTVVALLALALLGGGALVGSLADVVTQFVDIQDAGSGVDVSEATETAREAARWAALGLGATLIAAAVGGSIGSKLWPGKGRNDADAR